MLDFSVVTQERLYQMVCCQSASAKPMNAVAPANWNTFFVAAPGGSASPARYAAHSATTRQYANQSPRFFTITTWPGSTVIITIGPRVASSVNSGDAISFWVP